MKTVFYFLVKTALILSVALSIGCSKDDPSNPNSSVADPEGTISLSVNNESNGDTWVPFNDYDSFSIDNANNFDGIGWLFASVGAVKGLGNVTKIPDSGWATKSAVTPGNGYVAAYPNGNYITFARIYVEDWITDAGSNGIIGAKIKYQYPFNGTATAIGLSQKSVTLKLTFVNGEYEYASTPITLNKVSCTITNINGYTGSLSFDGTTVKLTIYNYYLPNSGPATLTVSSPGLPDEQIAVTVTP